MMPWLFFLQEIYDYKKLSAVYSGNDIIAVFVFFLLTVAAFILAATKYQGKSKKLYTHFLACFFLKILGALLFVALYTYYYGGGDTMNYYRNAKPLIAMASYNPATYIEVISQTKVNRALERYPIFYQNYQRGQEFEDWAHKKNFLVVRFAALFGAFTMGSYLAINLCFAFMSTLGVWALYRTFTRLFPGHENALAIPVIYFPSLWFWGSSLMKDSIVMAFLGFFTYAIFKIFIQKRNPLLWGVVLAISIYCLSTTKEYVLISYIPALILWLVLSVSNGFNRFWRIAMRPILLLFALAAIFVVGPQVGKVSEAYALEQVLATAETTSTYIARVTEEKGGTGYSLGNVSYTPQGLIVLFPRAVTVTLYQPMLYEVSNPVMLFSALESTAVLFFTIFMLFRIGLARFVSILTDNPFLLAALVFSVFFAFAVGVSTLNYGSLARYKIPCLPFYGLAVIYPYSLYRKQRKAREEERKVKTALA